MAQESQQIDPIIGSLVSARYRVIRKIGEGGMGTVYEARHEAIEKRIALKVLHAEYSSSPEVLERFKQEAISASRIKHQNVIDVFDFGQLDDGACFIAMEYLDGMDLGDALQKRGAFPADDAIRIIVQVCRALGLGHTRGVVHRDLKPENVFLQQTIEGEEVVKIVDFGIAQLKTSDDPTQSAKAPRQRRLTKTGMIFGTPEYMAPEQARGQDVDQRSDIYATGIILYELLTGAVPFLGESFLDVLNKHTMAKVPPMSEANPNVEISRELQRVVYKALEKQPDDRFPTMKELSHAVLRTPEGRAVRSRISSITSREDVDLDDSMRLENAEYPSPKSGDGTAMFGSPGTPGFESVPVHSGQRLAFVVGAVALGILGLVGYLVFGGDSSARDATGAELEKEAPSVAPPASAPLASAPGGVEPSAPVETPKIAEIVAPTEVTLHVTTEPAGAVVMKDGFQVCEASPCDVIVAPGDAVTLTAELGAAKGSAKVLAQREQGVAIQLKAPSAPRGKPKPADSAMCEVMVDGLKILRPCN